MWSIPFLRFLAISHLQEDPTSHQLITLIRRNHALWTSPRNHSLLHQFFHCHIQLMSLAWIQCFVSTSLIVRAFTAFLCFPCITFLLLCTIEVWLLDASKDSISHCNDFATHGTGRRQRGEKRPIPEEQKDEKYYERRRRNNQAAKKSRDARKLREDQVWKIERKNKSSIQR